jgi:hypothetical protein
MNLKPLLSTTAALFLCLNAFAQKQTTEKKYKYIFKLVETNVWRNFFLTTSLAFDDPNDTDINKFIMKPATFKYKNFSMGIKPSFVLITKRQNQIEIGLSASFNSEKNINYDGKTLVKQVEKNIFGLPITFDVFPKNLQPKSVEKNRSLYTSISASYGFRLSKKDSKTVFLLGPSFFAYRAPDNDYPILIVDDQPNGIEFGIVPKFGYHAGKRMYVEMASPFSFYKIDRGFNNNEHYFVNTNYLTKLFNKTDYDRIFKLQFSVGYKL